MVTESMLNSWPIDPAIVILSLGVITILLLIMVVSLFLNTSLYSGPGDPEVLWSALSFLSSIF